MLRRTRVSGEQAPNALLSVLHTLYGVVSQMCVCVCCFKPDSILSVYTLTTSYAPNRQAHTECMYGVCTNNICMNVRNILLALLSLHYFHHIFVFFCCCCCSFSNNSQAICSICVIYCRARARARERERALEHTIFGRHCFSSSVVCAIRASNRFPTKTDGISSS